MDIAYDIPEDFAADDSFVNYCFHSDEDDFNCWMKWLDKHPDKRKIADQARDMVFMMGIKLPSEMKRREWEKVKAIQGGMAGNRDNTRSSSRAKIFRRASVIAAASLLVIIGLGIVVIYRAAPRGMTGTEQATGYSTASGQQHAVLLADGTHILLNADSKLTIDHDFDHDATREVTLVGEAYFDVAKNASRPFVIHTRSMNITVLGTTLNVKAYPSDETMEAALISGSVEVSLVKDDAKKILLKPHEKIVVFNDQRWRKEVPDPMKYIASIGEKKVEFKIAPLETYPESDSGTMETAWTEGKIVFRQESFDQLALQMERKYSVQFHFADDDLEKYRFTGIFSTETIGEALHALQLTSPSDPFDYRVEGNEVYITKVKGRK